VGARATADWAGDVTRYELFGACAEHLSERVSLRAYGEAVHRILEDCGIDGRGRTGAGPVDAVGHRIVHGGDFSTPVLITPEVRERIAALAELAPLHNPPGLEALAAAQKVLVDVPHVAVFDTAFHATLPAPAYTYALPETWTKEWKIRKYGFHGLSHSYCAGRAAEMLGRPREDLRLVICHLGHGCSAAAVEHGRSVDTTMGFTPLDGLMMATRSGSIDPGIVTHVQLRRGLDARDVETSLNQRAGLYGVSGLSGDMRDVLGAARDGAEQARLAIDVYAHRVRQAIGALTVTMGGADALVFAGGVGEHAAEVRAAVCRGLECLGFELDAEANVRRRADADMARPGSAGRILVIATREDLAMLREVVRVIAA
jgi:acetate kinase